MDHSQDSDLKKLIQAIKSNNSKKVRLILSKSPKLQMIVKSPSKDSKEISPLWEAMLGGHAKIVELLVKEFGANPDEQCYDSEKVPNEYTFLQFTIDLTIFGSRDFDEWRYRRDFEVAEVLIKYGADVNQFFDERSLYNDYQHLIAATLYNGNLKFAELLLKNGARIEGVPEVRLAFCVRNEEFNLNALKLLQKYGYNLKNLQTEREKANLLHIIPEYHPKMILPAKFLIDCGVPINGRDFEGSTPLHYAASSGKFELVKLLVERGADLSARNDRGNSPLHLVYCISSECKCKKGHEKTTRFLIQAGSDLKAQNNFGETVLSKFMPSFYPHYSKESFKFIIAEITKQESFETSNVCDVNSKIIQKYPKFKEYYQACKTELSLLESTKFYPPYSYYTVLKLSKNIKKLAKLLKNDDFVTSFRQNLSSNFLIYFSDLEKIFNDALILKMSASTIENNLSSVFKGFLPDVVIRNLAEKLTVEDLSLLLEKNL